jgi:hypothetical protein
MLWDWGLGIGHWGLGMGHWVYSRYTLVPSMAAGNAALEALPPFKVKAELLA